MLSSLRARSGGMEGIEQRSGQTTLGEAVQRVIERMEDRVADQLRDGRDYCVPKGVQSQLSHPGGNPIMPSTQEGHGTPLNSIDKPTCFPIRIRRWMDGIEQSPLSRQSEASGVGNDPHPVTDVRGTSGSRGDALPLCIIPERGQRPENVAKPSIKQLWRVFHDDEAGANFANQACIFGPQSTAFAAKPTAIASRRKVLAGEPSTDDINGNSIGSKSFAGKLADIAVAGDIRPVLGEDFAGVFFDFAERDGFKATSSLQSKREAADAGKEIQHLEFGCSRGMAFSATRRASAPAVRPIIQQRDGVSAAQGDGLEMVGGGQLSSSNRSAVVVCASSEANGAIIGRGNSTGPTEQEPGAADDEDRGAAHAAAPVSRARATIGDSADAFSAPPVTASTFIARSAGQSVELRSCESLPFETAISVASAVSDLAPLRFR